MENRQPILDFITNIIEEQGGNVSDESTKIYDTGIDSFSIAVLYLELDEEYECFDSSYNSNTPRQELEFDTIGDLVDRVISWQEGDK